MDPPGASRSGVRPARLGQCAIFSLGIHDPGLPSPRQLAPQEGLDKGRFTAAHLAEDNQVRVRQHALSVEVPGVEAKRPTEEVPADERTAAADIASGDKGVDRLEVRGRRPMGGRRLHRSGPARITPTRGPRGASR